MFVVKLAQFTESRYNGKRGELLHLLRKLQALVHSNESPNSIRSAHIPPENAEVVVCMDAAFAANMDKSSQLGVLSMLRNAKNYNTNIIHYESTKSKKVFRCVLAAELFALADRGDIKCSTVHELGAI